jgi:hypothetical protein
MRDEGGLCPHPRRRSSGFAASMAPADHDDIEFRDFRHVAAFI